MKIIPLILSLFLFVQFASMGKEKKVTLNKKIEVKISKESIEDNYQHLVNEIDKFDRNIMYEKVLTKFSNCNKLSVRDIRISSVKETSEKTFKDKKVNQKAEIYVKVSIEYEKSKTEEATEILNYCESMVKGYLTEKGF